jgi:hypothetical protein
VLSHHSGSLSKALVDLFPDINFVKPKIISSKLFYLKFLCIFFLSFSHFVRPSIGWRFVIPSLSLLISLPLIVYAKHIVRCTKQETGLRAGCACARV